jgi:uncharacterized lipoprotein
MKANLVAFITCTFLAACTNTPTHLIITPVLTNTPNLQYDNKNAQLEVIDMRTASHIIQILQEGQAATLISPRQNLAQIIQETLSKHWQNQGLNITELAKNSITVSIEKAVISVDQQTINYQSQSEIILTVQINNGQQTLTNTYTNRGNSNGPLKADVAVLERNFNQRLTRVLTEILATHKINSFIH